MDTPPCRDCHKPDGVICYPDDHSQAICPECCAKTKEHHDGESGHQFAYERGEGWACRYCGILRECTDYDYSGDCLDGDASISLAEPRAPGEKLGTPLGELSGQPGSPGYDKFKRIAKSWGYD